MRQGFTVESFVWVPAFAGSTDLDHQLARVGDAAFFGIGDSSAPKQMIVQCAAPAGAPNTYRGLALR